MKEIVLGYVQNSIRSAKRQSKLKESVAQLNQDEDDLEKDKREKVRQNRRDFKARKEDLKRKQRHDFANNFYSNINNTLIKVFITKYQ